MLQLSAIFEIRKRLGIPVDGLASNVEATQWFRRHYENIKGRKFRGSLGFRYLPESGLFELEHKISRKGLWIAAPYPLDQELPIDHEIATLAIDEKIPEWAAPALRLVILVRCDHEMIELLIPEAFYADLGTYRVLAHPSVKVSLRKWKRTGELLGAFKNNTNSHENLKVSHSYKTERHSEAQELYRQTLSAYMDAIGRRRMNGKRGKYGLLRETAVILRDIWGYQPDAYTVRRYLDRAEKIWRVSTKWETYRNPST